jgi:succinate dehydrogenase / fumarate reductase cytochrome b subunit
VPLEVGLIAIPIGFHALYGLYVTYLAQNNPLNYRYFRNWLFYLQRLTAIITLCFVLWHVWVLRIGKALYGKQITFEYMAQLLSDPVTFALYAAGLTAGLFHFANGVWAFMITWGITIGPRAQTVSMYACSLGFLVLDIIGLKALAAFTI